jgi:hypothetical protein
LLVIILALVLIVVYYLMVTDYLEQRREYQALAPRTDEAAQLLAQIPPPPADLEQRLSAAQSGLEAVINSFPDILNTTGIINAVLLLADDAGVIAIPLVTQPWTVENVSDHDYLVFRLNITATGDFTRLADFINRLETGEPPTLVIESLLVERVTDASMENAQTLFEARLEIVVYARAPDAEEEKVE